MRHIKNAYYNISYRTRLLVMFLAGALIPYALSALLVGTYMFRTDRAEAVSKADQMVSRMNSALDTYFRTPDEVIDYYVSALTAPRSVGYMDLLENVAEGLYAENRDIAGITAVTADDIVFAAGIERVSRDSLADEDWYRAAEAANGKTIIIEEPSGRKIIRNTNEQEDNLLSMARSFTITERGPARSEIRKDAVLLLDVRRSVIDERMQGLFGGSEGFMFFVDHSGNIFYAPDNPVVYRIDSEVLQGSLEGYTIVQVDREQYLLTSAENAFTGWQTVCAIPSASYEQGRDRIMQILLLGGLIFAALVTAASMYFSRKSIQMLETMSDLMDRVEEGDFTAQLDVPYTNEVGQLATHFNRMVFRMDELVNTLQVEKQIRLEAELQRVQEQIKPHFLYNTLDTINWLARDGQTEEVVRMVEALTNMFRLGLSRGRDNIPLRDEKNHVANYLYIQKARYGQKITYRIDIAPEWEDVLVPKLILQPLVENAIYHGIKLKRGGGTILITAGPEGDIFRLTVRDDGAGVPPDKLEEIQQQLDTPGGDRQSIGFGMYYIAERVRLFYGEGSRTVIESEEGVYTSVSILIPMELITREEQENV